MVSQHDDIFEPIFAGILAAFDATAFDTGGDDYSRCMTLANAALASLEASGFKIVPQR